MNIQVTADTVRVLRPGWMRVIASTKNVVRTESEAVFQGRPDIILVANSGTSTFRDNQYLFVHDKSTDTYGKRNLGRFQLEPQIINGKQVTFFMDPRYPWHLREIMGPCLWRDGVRIDQ